MFFNDNLLLQLEGLSGEISLFLGHNGRGTCRVTVMGPQMNIRGGDTFVLTNISAAMALTISMVISRHYIPPKYMTLVSAFPESCPQLIPPTDHAFLAKVEISYRLINNSAKFYVVSADPPFFSCICMRRWWQRCILAVSVTTGNKKQLPQG